MKKLVLLMMVAGVCVLWGLELEMNIESVHLTGDFQLENIKEITISDSQFSQIRLSGCSQGGLPQQPAIEHFSKLLALPEAGNWQVADLHYKWDELELSHPIITNSRQETAGYERINAWYPEDIVNISDPVIMRQSRFSQLSVAGMQYNPAQNKVRIIKNLDLELRLQQSINIKLTSGAYSGSAFDKIAASSVSGYPGSRNQSNGSYLMICPDLPEVVYLVEYLAQWKRKLGHQVVIATLTETGSTNSEILDFLQNAYDNWDDRPEYVMLVGDVSGNIVLPSWYIVGYATPYDVTDHPYSLLEGEDYFSDVLIGRISVQSLVQLQTVFSKIMGYEGNPPLESNWFRQALMCCYVSDDHYDPEYSQRETVMAVREKLLDFTYTEVDTFVSPYQSGITNLANMINGGYSFINYRGAGSPFNWAAESGSMFNINNFSELHNGFMLPMVTSIVCGGCDFADASYSTCFGETWLTAGSPQNPIGGIAFIGPSEHDTKTSFNNCNDMGIYQGITQEGIFGAAAMMLRGKMELYINYPGCHQMDGIDDAFDSDMLYFYAYNLLGDPGLEIWTDTPQNIEAEIPRQVAQSASQLQMQVLNIPAEGFTVAVTTVNELYASSITQSDGSATVSIPPDEESFYVTISAYGYLPLTIEIQRTDTIQEVNLESYTFSQEPETGAESELVLNIRNTTATALSTLTISVVTDDEQVSLPVTEQTIHDLAAGETAVVNFYPEFTKEWRQETESRLEIRFNEGELGSYHISYQIKTPQIEYAGHQVQNAENCLLIGESNELILELLNTGNKGSGNFTAIITSTDGKCDISTDECSYININPQAMEIGSSAFRITPHSSLLQGEPLDFSISIINNSVSVWEIRSTIAAGLITESSPTFSNYGYVAFENSDSGNGEIPEYDWIEIAEPAGGAGDAVPIGHETCDGYSTRISLPFQFSYYGMVYDEITVCSEGWLAMGEVRYVTNENRTIPSGGGPAGMIAPFWDEMSGGTLYTQYNEEGHYFIVEWYDLLDITLNNHQTFQVILYDEEYYPTVTGDGKIKFQYLEIHNSDQNGFYATIGIENHLQTDGLLMSYADIYPETVHPVEAGTAILFSIREGMEIPLMEVDQNAISISLPTDTTFVYQLGMQNLNENSSLDYEVSFSHYFPQDTRNISDDTLIPVTQTYKPGQEMDVEITLVHYNLDNEAIHVFYIFAPEYVMVNGATDMAELPYNNATGYGVQMYWGDDDSYYNGNTPQTFHIYITVDEGVINSIPFGWAISGNGIGDGPHVIGGRFYLLPSEGPYLWMQYPNGGEEIAYGICDTIRWLTNGDIPEVDVYYSTDFFQTYELIDSGVPNVGELEWVVPYEPVTNARIRVSNTNGAEFDDSDDSFIITGLVITNPYEGAVLQYGSLADITWELAGAAPTVNIAISTNNGNTWLCVADDVPNTGAYSFEVNYAPSTCCKIRIATSDGNIEQTMSGVFSIIDPPVNWISCEEMQGTLQPLENRNLSLLLDTHGMEQGQYLAYITLTTDHNQDISLPVSLEVKNSNNQIPETSSLSHNFPNPFYYNSSRGISTKINYSICQPGHVKLAAYNIKGQIVRVFIDAETGSGNYGIDWDGTDNSGNPLASGVYFYQLQIDGKPLATKKCLLLK
ncbi:MAG: hypothetical protein K9N06_03495 [Candidatus Cloacimonetes bacterium]|nr:hypothetical protein [Candidatus Cloacimonadota bacterium]